MAGAGRWFLLEPAPNKLAGSHAYSPNCREQVFSETRTAPVLLHQDREMLPPSYRIGY